jgi:plastocyanin
MNEGTNRTPLIIGIVVVAVIAAGAWLWLGGSSSPTQPGAVSDQMPAPAATTSPDAASSGTGTTGTSAAQAPNPGAPISATVVYNGTSFSPATVAIAKGGTVKFVDQSGGGMWVASNPHPVHTGYDGTTEQQHCAPGYSGPAPFDQCSPGASFSFTFDKMGTWGYHNHFNTSAHGTVVVQ